MSEEKARQFDCRSDEECFNYYKIQKNCCRYTGTLPGEKPNRCMVRCTCPIDISPNCYGEKYDPNYFPGK